MEISVSYAVIYMDAKSGKFLIVHPTHETYWSLPKGGMEEADGGDGAKAAARELFEETAIKAAPAALKYGGRHDYYRAGRNGKSKNKDLCIYLYETDEAMKTSAILQKAWREDPSALPLGELVGMATVNGAKALRFNGGVLAEGAAADISIVDTDNTFFLSNAPFLANFVYSAHSDCIDSVICNGRFIMRGREIPGEKEILSQARRVLGKII